MPTADSDDARIDDLYGLPAGEFVAAREALARELRSAGRKDAAAEVHSLRRPTLVPWSINQVARTHADQVADLVAAGTEVQDAQRQAADGFDSDLRAASRRRRALLDQLTDAAAALTDNPSGQRAAIESTLDGASLEPELQPALLGGRLSKELPPTARFSFGDAGAFGDASAPPPTARPAPARHRTATPARDELAFRRARQALEQARTRADDAATEASDATHAVTDAEQELQVTTRQIADLQAAIDAARAELVDAKRRVTEAKRAETAAKTAERRATAALRSAEAAVVDQPRRS